MKHRIGDEPDDDDESSKGKKKVKSREKDPDSSLVPSASASAPAGWGSSTGGGVIGSKRHGGKIKKTGRYKLHKGEYVLTAKKAKNYCSTDGPKLGRTKRKSAKRGRAKAAAKRG